MILFDVGAHWGQDSLDVTQHTKQEALDFLEQNGFVIERVTSQVNEDNLFFARKK